MFKYNQVKALTKAEQVEKERARGKAAYHAEKERSMLYYPAWLLEDASFIYKLEEEYYLMRHGLPTLLTVEAAETMLGQVK